MAIRRIDPDELENKLNKGAIWAVTYGDLMSYLMIFFLVLFSFTLAQGDKTRTRRYEESLSNIQKAFGGKMDEKRLERAQAKANEDSVAKKLEQSLNAAVMNNSVQVLSSESKIRLILKEAVLFDSAKADLKDSSQHILSVIAKDIATLPNQVVVEGHTDNVPIRGGKFASNWELSMSRAYSVIHFLEQNGIPPKRLAGIGYGEFSPVADNATPDGRAKNRRIEIDLIKTE